MAFDRGIEMGGYEVSTTNHMRRDCSSSRSGGSGGSDGSSDSDDSSANSESGGNTLAYLGPGDPSSCLPADSPFDMKVLQGELRNWRSSDCG